MNFVLFESFGWAHIMGKQILKCSKASACLIFIQQEQKIRKPPENTVMCMYAFSRFLKVFPECRLFQLQLNKTDGITRLARLMVTNNDFDQVDSVPDPTAVEKEELHFSKLEQERTGCYRDLVSKLKTLDTSTFI